MYCIIMCLCFLNVSTIYLFFFQAVMSCLMLGERERENCDLIRLLTYSTRWMIHANGMLPIIMKHYR